MNGASGYAATGIMMDSVAGIATESMACPGRGKWAETVPELRAVARATTESTIAALPETAS